MKKTKKPLKISDASEILDIDSAQVTEQIDKNIEVLRMHFEKNIEMLRDMQMLVMAQVDSLNGLVGELSPELIQSVLDAGSNTVDDSIDVLREKMIELKDLVSESSMPKKDKKELLKTLDKSIEESPVNKTNDDAGRGVENQNKNFIKQRRLIKEVFDITRLVGGAFEENNDVVAQTMTVMTAVASGTMGVIDAITSVSRASKEAIEGGAKAAVFSLKTVEGASVVLAVISAALTVATAIANIFSSRAKQREEQLKQEQKSQRSILKSEIEYQKALSDRLFLEKSITSEKIKQAKQNIKSSAGSTDKVYDSVIKQYNHLMGRLKNEDWSAGAAQDVFERAKGFLDLANAIKSGDLDKVSTLEFVRENDKDMWSDYQRMAQTALEQQQRWRDELKEIANGITGSASDYMGEFVEALQQGEQATYNFAENFKKRMRDAIISGLADNMIFAKVDNLIKKVQDQIMGDNGVGIDGITKDMMDAWVGEFEKIQEESLGVSKVIEGIVDGLGLDSVDPNKKLSNAIQGVSEETASVISGQMNAIRSAQLRQIDISTQQLGVLKEISAINFGNDILQQSVSSLSQIAANTRHLLRLESIERSLSQINSAVGSPCSQNGLKSQGLSI